jgi:dihydrofolate synthase/folylpolyglutamate synthase
MAERALADWLHWQESLHPRAIEMGLGRVCAVASRLELPDQQIRTLTVAGTNGKGSSATLAAEIYRAAGYRVGLYTSPHLLRYNERISINGKLASDAELCCAFEAIEQSRNEISLTYFEFGTLAALWLFREARVDVQVLEVGLGGRLDAVNLVDADCALITHIGLDHTDWLGADRETIAVEKAGVMRAGKPAIYVDEHPTHAITEISRLRSVPLQLLHREFDYRLGIDTWDWQAGGQTIAQLPWPGLKGEAQLRNAAGVIAAVRALTPVLPVQESAIREALPKLKLPGRYERIGQVILDVAHNTEAAEVLADNLRQVKSSGRIFLILAMLADKPVENFAKILAPCVQNIAVAGLHGPRGLSGEKLGQRLQHEKIATDIYPDVLTAFKSVQSQVTSEDLIVVTGSFLTVAAVMEVLHD